MLDLVGTWEDRFSQDAVHNEMNLFSDGLYIFKVAVSLECCFVFVFVLILVLRPGKQFFQSC